MILLHKYKLTNTNVEENQRAPPINAIELENESHKILYTRELQYARRVVCIPIWYVYCDYKVFVVYKKNTIKVLLLFFL